MDFERRDDGVRLSSRRDIASARRLVVKVGSSSICGPNAGHIDVLVDALAAALSLGEVRAVNLVMVGAASPFLPLPPEAYEEAIRARMKGKVADVNVEAFRAGRKEVAG